MNLIRPIALLLLLTGPAIAQGQVDFGGLTQDTSLPVEVTADQLDVNQNDGSAVFNGNVLVTQGEMRLTAQRILVNYAGQDLGRIQTLNATGGVTLVNGAEAAESQEAVYDIDSGEVVMTGEVLLTQGQTALSGNRLVIDLETGTGRMEGRVRTIFEPSGQ
ncbi:Lipopolysaccharide export system protein LptA precursor [Rhodobacteraceae bacterium THAF1]|uniref:lipopolysaccharide transport periplasmic protein LptA n=1 Tax=Palleronia sp. THAF1 TaxID=2587842 RepID=UPI000F3E24A1|nr:lipopolysaccharide transport periplasmic protein LptA [Palleronia sp. THAF1]QFU07112.1 Lipopolysaccharide export system protein LptA precursor [Palleronia sp. THAF1]VDC16735.1 Lipopolysaccharide export system protein LptA precursor [Rhodobacteraceae bacterium THAF1]